MRINDPPDVLARAQGSLLGQLSGDALGSLVEFETAAEILKAYPQGVRELADGGTWDTIAGQPTDDSELALLLARLLVAEDRYDAQQAFRRYQFWLDSEPFDCGATTATGLRGQPNVHSQANGALMRISPLGIFGARHPLSQVAQWAEQDAALTHPHPVCQHTNALLTMAIAHAIRTPTPPHALYQQIRHWAAERDVHPTLRRTIEAAALTPPEDYLEQQGWVLIAWGNALWQLLHAPSLEAGVVDTVMRGGDTDTNAAICGALLGAVYGVEHIPQQWRECVLSCRPQATQSGVFHPRPECFWPVDALELAAQLVGYKP